MVRFVFLCLFAAPILAAQTRELDLQPSSGWVDTGLDVKPGDGVRVSATGTLQYPDARQSNGPEGLPRAYKDLLRNLLLNDAGRGTLIGRIGDNAAARPFSIGNQYSGKAWVAGRFYVAVNQTSSDQPTGSYHVTLEFSPATAVAPDANKPVAVPEFTQSMIDSIPTRVSDPNGAPGDRVNFVIIGSQEQMQAAFKAAGWVTVDRTRGEAVVRGLFASLSKEAYVTLPMSELRLFGRAQDFGYAQADPLRVVASRHHFRIWKAPFELQGQTVWVGAGTHDVGFDRDQRNNGVTHKIDPETDGERDYIRDGLMQTGLVVKTGYVTATDPVLKARTATGEEFSSDGRTLLVYLTAGSGNQ